MAKKVEYKFDPLKIAGVKKSDVPKRALDDILSKVADYVKESVLSYVADEESPVSGRGAFKALSKKSEYTEEKKDLVGNTKANLENTGALLDSVKVVGNGSALVLTVDSDQMGKADGHNNHSGDSNLPTRRFIPKAKDGETFKRDILDGIKQIVKDEIDDLP
jgi:hypothetical protein